MLIALLLAAQPAHAWTNMGLPGTLTLIDGFTEGIGRATCDDDGCVGVMVYADRTADPLFIDAEGVYVAGQRIAIDAFYPQEGILVVAADRPHAWALPDGTVYVACGISVAMETTMYGVVAVDGSEWTIDLDAGSLVVTDDAGSRSFALGVSRVDPE